MVSDIQFKATTDTQLIKGCIEGQRAYQQFLYNTFASTMFGICLRYASDYQTAEDILQEGFVKVFKNLDRFRGEGSFEGWMKRIFINTAIEYHRKSLRHINHSALDDQHLQYSFSPEAIQQLFKEDLLKLLQSLPVGYRTVFNLYAIEGYNHREIGEMLNISEGTSKSQLARARAYLKKLISEQKVYESQEQ